MNLVGSEEWSSFCMRLRGVSCWACSNCQSVTRWFSSRLSCSFWKTNVYKHCENWFRYIWYIHDEFLNLYTNFVRIKLNL